MSEKENIVEKNLPLDELVGGKGIFINEIVPPNIPPPAGGNDGNIPGGRLPELINSQVDEVLNRPPSWLVSWGTTVFFLALLILLGITWFVQYPDLVGSSLKVVANNLPKTVTSKAEGQLVRLFVKEGQQVQQGEVLAYMESTADHEEVAELEEQLNNLIQLSAQNNLEAIYSYALSAFFRLGELQKSYQSFQEALLRSKAAESGGIFSRKKITIGGEINSLKRLHQNTIDQLALQEKDLQMAYEEAQSQSRLAEKGFVSQLDAKNAMSKYLSKKQSLEQAKSTLENNNISQSQKQQEVIELEKNMDDQKSSLLQSLNTLKSDIEAWKQRYITIAPASGKVIFLSHLQENQIIKAGQELLYILPEGSGYYGEMYVGQYNFGKVKNGQEVIVKFQSYPFQEFGTVKGRVNYISDIPKDSTYLVKIGFPEGLVTSSKKQLPFRNGMTASGEIITENLRLIEKFFYDIRKSMKR